MRSHPKHGFTLIELSIVLVIIGLIVGGVLVGRDLIKAAEVRSTVGAIEQYHAAVRTFQSKYNCIPGDCPNAFDFGLHCNGNGDGLVWGGFNLGADPSGYNCDSGGATGNGEVFFAGGHLDMAHLLPNPVYHFYYNSVATHTAVGADLFFATPGYNTTNDDANIILSSTKIGLLIMNRRGSNSPTPCPLDWCSALTPADTYAMDTKLDDGMPTTGKFYNQGDFVYLTGVSVPGIGDARFAGAGGANSAFCLNNGVTPNVYNTQNSSDKVCLPFFTFWE